MSEPFDVIPFNDIKDDWKKLGAGSFGNVYKGNYLGIDVAIKEVLPSTEYDVAKYFEREWRLMKECRHPNICLFIGLSRAPEPDNRIFIVSEYIENGNVRLYIHDKSKPFPWRLRLSFAIDVTRALAYLHARKCIHRDLKGENLLVTANGRIKVTDFGFARIAARNEEESKRLTFCGTDSYMSPEILLGDEFDLPTDVFSLGIIFCEIAARQLADDTHFKRYPPTFGIDHDELHRLASPGCPPDFIKLCLDCLNIDPAKRPTTREILDRLRIIEAELLLHPESEDAHIGSIKFITGGKRPANAPRIPSFGAGVGKNIRHGGDNKGTDSSDSSDDELIEAVMNLSKVGHRLDSNISSTGSDTIPLLGPTDSLQTVPSQYSTSVIRSHPSRQNTPPPSLSSVLTVRPSPDPNSIPTPILPATPLSDPSPTSSNPPVMNESSTFSIATLDSYHTAPTVSTISTTMATEGSFTVRSLADTAFPLVHRFTLIKPGTKPRKLTPNMSNPATLTSDSAGYGLGVTGWNPLDLFFASGLLVAKCDVCFKRLGWKPVLECDDCGMKAHIKCGEIAPTDCGTRPMKSTAHQPHSHSPLHVISSLSRVKQTAVQTSEAPKPKAGTKSHGNGHGRR